MWYKKRIEDLIIETGTLEKAFDKKYGNYDYNYDLRGHTEPEFLNTFTKIINKTNGSFLITGANSGYEAQFLPLRKITAIDISSVAIKKFKTQFPLAKSKVGDMCKLEFDDNSFDCYINMRAITSYGVDFTKTISEALRVLKFGGQFVFSISNGYLDLNKNIIKGYYLREEERVSLNASYKIKDEILSIFGRYGIKVSVSEITSEIILYGNNK